MDGLSTKPLLSLEVRAIHPQVPPPPLLLLPQPLDLLACLFPGASGPWGWTRWSRLASAGGVGAWPRPCTPTKEEQEEEEEEEEEEAEAEASTTTTTTTTTAAWPARPGQGDSGAQALWGQPPCPRARRPVASQIGVVRRLLALHHDHEQRGEALLTPVPGHKTEPARAPQGRRGCSCVSWARQGGGGCAWPWAWWWRAAS